MTKQLLNEIANEALEFVFTRRSLELSTVNTAGEPLASYAPFYRDNSGVFYIFVSTLSTHTANLANGLASILIVEDEQDSRQIYARVRLCFKCNTERVLPEIGEFREVLGKLKDKHGDVIDTLSSLSDFRLYKLNPLSGRYVKGFGQAYEINPELTRVIPIDR